MINLSTHPYQPNGLSIDSLGLLSSLGTLEVCCMLVHSHKFSEGERMLSLKERR
jgi:hypothetical protein